MSVVLPKPNAKVPGISSQKPILPGQKLMPVLGVVVAVAVVMIISFIAFHGRKASIVIVADDQICSSTILQKAGDAIDRKNTKALIEIATKVNMTARHEKDANCMLVLLVSSLQTSDPKNARVNFDQLKKVYTPSKGFKSQLGQSAALSVDGLSAKVISLEQRAAQFNKSMSSHVEPEGRK